MKLSGRFPKPEPDYSCPLCQDPAADLFAWSPILKQPICYGCDYEIWAYVVTAPEKESPPSCVITDLEKLTDLSFDEYRLIELEYTVNVMGEALEKDPEMSVWLKQEIVRLKSLLETRASQ